MKQRFASIIPVIMILTGSFVSTVCVCGIVGVLPACATVAGDPVATNAARFKDESHRVSIIYDAWAKALEADTRREQAKISNARREQAKQIRIQIDSIMAEWKASVEAGQPFSWTDSAVSLLGAMAAFAEEASE